MSLFREFIEGIATGFLASRNAHYSTLAPSGGHSAGRIERLCYELGWPVDEKRGDDIYLHFNDKSGHRRTVYISSGDADLVLFAVLSEVTLREHHLTQELLGSLLVQNAKVTVGAWHLHLSKDRTASPGVLYCALGSGLSAAVLKFICLSMIGEVADFEAKMRSAGRL